MRALSGNNKRNIDRADPNFNFPPVYVVEFVWDICGIKGCGGGRLKRNNIYVMLWLCSQEHIIDWKDCMSYHATLTDIAVTITLRWRWVLRDRIGTQIKNTDKENDRLDRTENIYIQ